MYNAHGISHGASEGGGFRCTGLLVPVLRCIDRDADQTILYTARGRVSTLYGMPNDQDSCTKLPHVQYETAHRYGMVITTASMLVKTAVPVTLGTLQYACTLLVPAELPEPTRLMLLHLA
jgi:hypothetical protein